MLYDAEMARLQRSARSAAARLAAAQQAREAGNMRVAGRLLRVLVSRRRTPRQYQEAARTALGEMREQAQQRMAELEQRIAASAARQPPSAGDISAEVLEILGDLNEDVPLTIHPNADSTRSSGHQAILTTLAQMEDLIWQHETVPGVARGLRRRLARLRRDERYAAIWNEPKAAELWQQGQRHEQAEEFCCAYLAYERAARLMPSRSARLADRRFRELSRLPSIAPSVERCRQLRACHKKFQLGELFAKAGRIAHARASFEQVKAAAPPESAVYAAAQAQLDRLGSDS
jgi:hypothetical protein